MRFVPQRILRAKAVTTLREYRSIQGEDILTFRLTIILFVSFLAGCAATVNRPASTATEARLAIPPGTRAVQVILVPAPQLQLGEDWTALLEEWKTSLDSASEQQKFEAKLLDREPEIVETATVLARVTVNDYRYVSQAKRYGIGVLSGNAFLDLNVDFFAPPEKRVIGSRKFATSSSAWEGVFSAMTPKQVEAVANEIVKEATPK